MPVDAGALLLPQNKADLDWSMVMPNTEYFSSMLSLVKPVVDKSLTIQVERHGATSEMRVSQLKQPEHSLYVNVRLACDARFYDEAGSEMSVGEQTFKVSFKALKRALRKMGGNMNLAMFQLRSHKDTSLYIRVLEGSDCRKFNVPTETDPEVIPLPNINFQHNLYLPVQKLRDNMNIMHETSHEVAGCMTAELRSVPGAPTSHMVLVMRAKGVGSSVTELMTYVCPAPDLLAVAPVDAVTAHQRSAVDASATMRTTAVFREDVHDLPLLYKGDFKTDEIVKVLTEMRAETYVDMFLGRAPDDKTTGPMPMLIRMAGSPDLCMHFVVPEHSTNQTKE